MKESFNSRIINDPDLSITLTKADVDEYITNLYFIGEIPF